MTEITIDDLIPRRDLPEGHDPLGDGILMAHQRRWLEDKSPLKIAAKGRRTGITYAEALDDTIIAATARDAGGDNIFYIGDTKDKGREFIRYVAHFAKVVARELAKIDDYLFPDKQADGSTKNIAAFRITFSSGFQVVALSSRPANIRGLQGIVVIDEAAFHQDVAEVLDAVNALLIWNGRIRIISSHNGEENAFNRLILDTEKGLYDYKVHKIPFSLAVSNGLYERVCLVSQQTPSPDGKEKWLAKITRSYGPRIEARNQELEAIPARSSGVYLPRALVEKAQDPTIPIIRWSVAEDFYLSDTRLDVAKKWVADNLKPVIDQVPTRRRAVLGQDFGRTGDLSVIVIALEESPGWWRTAFQLEMRRLPFDVQQYVLFYIMDAFPRLQQAQLDARGNGQSHAEKAQQKYGPERVICVMATLAWYAEHFPKYQAALMDRTMRIAPGEDVISDHRLVILKAGSPSMSDERNKGADGEDRHGDSVIAYVLAHAATLGAAFDYEYIPASAADAAFDFLSDGYDDDGGRQLW